MEQTTRTIGVSQVREDFADLVNRVAYSNERVVIERRGRPLAALVSLSDLEILDGKKSTKKGKKKEGK